IAKLGATLHVVGCEVVHQKVVHLGSPSSVGARVMLLPSGTTVTLLRGAGCHACEPTRLQPRLPTVLPPGTHAIQARAAAIEVATMPGVARRQCPCHAGCSRPGASCSVRA